MRSLLNVAYVALAEGAEDVDELNRELEAAPQSIADDDRPRTAASDPGLAALMAATRMPQERAS